MVPIQVRRAARKFKKTRSEYYKYLASMIESSKGATKYSTLFERDAHRYENKPRGILASYWVTLQMNNGGNLAETWQGTMPDDEVSIIRVAQDAGDDALLAALRDVARISALSDKVKNETLGTLTAAFFGLIIALVMLTIFPIFSSSKLIETYSFIPLSEWGKSGKSFNNYAANVRSYGAYVVTLIIMIILYFQWSINNLIGPIREWLDQNVTVYRTIRDLKGALFLSTMSTLTRKRGNIIYTLAASLSTLASSAKSPWMRWRLEQIVEAIEVSGATGSEAFQTNLLSEEMYFFLRDTQEARGFAEGFDETGKYVESTIMNSIIGKLNVYKWVILIFGVMSVIGVMGWQFSVIYEMKGVMNNYFANR